MCPTETYNMIQQYTQRTLYNIQVVGEVRVSYESSLPPDCTQMSWKLQEFGPSHDVTLSTDKPSDTSSS